MKRNLVVFLLTLLLQLSVYAQGENFDSYQRNNGKVFTLHKDLDTKTLLPVSKGLIYFVNLDEGDSIMGIYGNWKIYGSVCYLPRLIWSDQAKIYEYVSNDMNWITVVGNPGGEILSTNVDFTLYEKTILNETTGVWFMKKGPERKSGNTEDGKWWNFKNLKGTKSKILYIIFNN